MSALIGLFEGRENRYLQFSSSAYYGVVAAIPMLIAYDLLLRIGGVPGVGEVRNLGDVWLREILKSLDIRQSHATMVMLFLLLLSIPVVRRHGLRLHRNYLLLMGVEALAYGLLLGVLQQAYTAISFFMVDRLSTAAAMPLSAGVTQNIALSIGAGLFEEFIFRVILVWVLLQISRFLLPGSLAWLAAIVSAAFLFSAAHYIGAMGDAFAWHSFWFRFGAGLIFTGLYYWRGFAVTAYTHALYNIQLLLF